MAAFYNELEAFPAAWLENLAAADYIAPGVVVQRDIRKLTPDDVAGHDQAHFFAGIGVWSYALRLAGWPDDLPVWTGSCPCQPFSSAGKRKGFDDDRHLWPEWFRLIREHRPRVVFGEQVGGATGRAWFDRVAADLEVEGYAVGSAELCPSVLGFPRRPRLFFVAHADGEGKPHGSFDGEVASVSPTPSLPLGERRVARDVLPPGDGSPARLAVLRAYGNAINAEAAALFIRAAKGALIDAR